MRATKLFNIIAIKNTNITLLQKKNKSIPQNDKIPTSKNVVEKQFYKRKKRLASGEVRKYSSIRSLKDKCQEYQSFPQNNVLFT